MTDIRNDPPIAAEEPAHDGVIVADDISDVDAALSTATQSMASLRSSVLDYKQENGRTYHSMSSGKIQHNTWILTLRGALALCPKVVGANRVLDIGTGYGSWAIEYADEHPNAEVIGVDLSPIQPTLVPPNVSFEVHDIEKDWTWTKPFDFIMSRVMTGSFSDYEAYFKKAYDALEPGGYFELQDLSIPYGCDDGTMTEDTFTWRTGKLTLEATIALGRPMNIAPTYKGIMEKVGFEGIVEQKLKWPIGTWPKDRHYKDLGYWALKNLDVGLEGLLMALFTRGLGWSKEEVILFCAGARAEFRKQAVHAYVPIYVVYGRKRGASADAPADAPADSSARIPVN